MNFEANPKISVIMVDGNFREKFHSIDFFRKQTFPLSDFELLWIEYYEKANPFLEEKIAKLPNFRVLTLGKKGIYHSSYCFNAGILASRGEVLVIPDADVVVEKDFLEKVWQEHQANDKLVMYIHRYNEPEEVHMAELTLEHLKKMCRLTNPTNYGGCLTIRKRWLLEINGYEQHPVFSSGEHANGWDVYTRLKNLGLHVKWHPGLKLYHPWHHGTLRAAPSYKLQHVIIDHRALSLATSAFQGINPLKNCEPPPALIDQIEAEKIKHNGTQTSRSSLVRAVRQAKKVVKKILHPIISP